MVQSTQLLNFLQKLVSKDPEIGQVKLFLYCMVYLSLCFYYLQLKWIILTTSKYNYNPFFKFKDRKNKDSRSSKYYRQLCETRDEIIAGWGTLCM